MSIIPDPLICPLQAPLAIPIIQIILSLAMVLSPFFEKSVDDEDYFSDLAMKYGAVVGSIVTGVPFYLLCIYKRTRLGIFDKLSGESTFSLDSSPVLC